MSLELFSTTPNDPGFLVTIDGPNGSGKTALTGAIVDELRARGVPVHRTCQPSPTSLGKLVRDAEIQTRGRSLACLVAADRHNQLSTEIEEQLSSGRLVICDRYIESSLVLQRLDDVPVDYILAINAGIRRPDLRMRLLAAPEILRQRLSERASDPGRRFEREGGSERELELYDEAERLLSGTYGLPATSFDTTDTETRELGMTAAVLVLQSRRAHARSTFGRKR